MWKIEQSLSKVADERGFDSNGAINQDAEW